MHQTILGIDSSFRLENSLINGELVRVAEDQ